MIRLITFGLICFICGGVFHVNLSYMKDLSFTPSMFDLVVAVILPVVYFIMYLRKQKV